MHIELEAIKKRFGSVQAIRHADLSVRSGEVVGLVGDNGAGKSTLMKILAGCIPPDEGTIRLDGREVHFSGPTAARDLGIEMLYQDLALFERLDISNNVFVGREVTRFGGFLKFGVMRQQTKSIVDGFSVRSVNASDEVYKLSGGQRQVAALARTIAFGSQIVILDEPTSALSPGAAEEVLGLIDDLTHKNIGVVMISHNLDHIMRVCHRVVVMRLGHTVGNLIAGNYDRTDVVSLMVGSVPQSGNGDSDEPVERSKRQ